MPTIIGETEDGELLSIGDYERRSGLYILGLPRTGKSWLMVNLMIQDIEQGHGFFFLDPHGDAIDDLLEYCPSKFLDRAFIFNPEYENLTFGINLFECSDITDSQARADTFTKAKGVFDKLWKNTFEEKPWLQLILQNTIYAFIENPGYTLAELPLFFRDSDFREFLISKMKYNRQVVDFWTKTFTAKSKHDQDEQMEAAQTRAEIMLGHPIVRDIVGQTKTTIDFNKIMEERKNVLVKFSTAMSHEAKKIIGTILISELLHAVQRRPKDKRHQFCIYIDEFQNFAGFEDFPILITQAPKLGIATTIAHHERYGQFANDPQVAGATAAIANKVLFQITTHDASVFASEFASVPPTEVKREPELIITQEPVADLLRRGHTNPEIQDFVNTLLRPWRDNLLRFKDEHEVQKLTRTVLSDEAALYRDEAMLSQIDARVEGAALTRYINYEAMRWKLYEGKIATEKALGLHEEISRRSIQLLANQSDIADQQERMRHLDRFFIALMDGRIKPYNKEEFAQGLVKAIGDGFVKQEHTPILHLYVLLYLGSPDAPRRIPGYLARKYWYHELEPVFVLQQIARFHQKKAKKNKGTRELYYTDKHLIQEIKESIIDLKKGYTTRYIAPLSIPDLPPRVLFEEEINRVEKICYEELMQGGSKHAFSLLACFYKACILLSRSENHILVPAGQYTSKLVNLRTEADMAGEAARELVHLPKYTTYVKILKNEGQTVWTGRLKTLKLKKDAEESEESKKVKHLLCTFAAEPYVRLQDKIEEEIQQRQESWKSLTAAPPPISLSTRTAEGTPLKREPQAEETPLEEPKFNEEAEKVRQEGTAALKAVTNRPVPTIKDAWQKDEAAEAQTDNTPEAELLYQSNFYLPDDKWLEGELRDGNIRSFRRDGYYHMVLSLSEWWIYRTPSIPLVNFRVHVNAEFLTPSGNSAYCGVVFRVNNDHGKYSFYYFTISRSGNYGLFFRVNEHWETILNYRPSEFIKSGDSSNSLLVEMAGQKITLGINGHFLATLLDNRLADGFVGLLIGTGSNDSFVEARFRDFRLYAP